jgi:hypothetical protein
LSWRYRKLDCRHRGGTTWWWDTIVRHRGVYYLAEVTPIHCRWIAHWRTGTWCLPWFDAGSLDRRIAGSGVIGDRVFFSRANRDSGLDEKEKTCAWGTCEKTCTWGIGGGLMLNLTVKDRSQANRMDTFT